MLLRWGAMNTPKKRGGEKTWLICSTVLPGTQHLFPSTLTDKKEEAKRGSDEAVSYTHLTLPTTAEV